MLIDWFTVGAQVLNFVVLVALMKHFLYQPVLDAISAREKCIADQVAEAAEKEKQAAAERKTFEDKNIAFDAQRAALLDKATANAQAQAEQLADEAAKAAQALATKHQHALANQAAHLQQTIAGRAATEVFSVARKALADLANADVEACMVDVFMQRLTDLPDPAKALLGAALKDSTDPALLRSHYALTDAQRAALHKAMKKTFAADVTLHFETAGDRVCGIELSVGGQKLAWTIDEYLRDLQHEVAVLLVTAAVPLGKPAAKSKHADKQQGDAKSVDAKPAPARHTDAKHSPAKPTEPKATDAKHSDAKHSGAKHSDAPTP